MGIFSSSKLCLGTTSNTFFLTLPCDWNGTAFSMISYIAATLSEPSSTGENVNLLSILEDSLQGHFDGQTASIGVFFGLLDN